METIIKKFSVEAIKNFFWNKLPNFSGTTVDFTYILKENEKFSELEKLGEVKLSDSKDMLFFTCKSEMKLSERSAKKIQYEITKRLMLQEMKDSAIAIFYDKDGDFRFSFVRRNYGSDERYSSWKRYTYFVSKNQTNKTFLERIEKADFSSLEKIQEAFSVEKLTKDFYDDLFKWYSWTLTDKVGITFPNDTRTSDDDKEKLEEKIIRLITRVLFVWFIKQKGLVPDILFKVDFLKEKLKDFEENSSESGNYYNAILQNLFFATLNRPISKRSFAKFEKEPKTLYRYSEMFSISETEILKLFEIIPFLNGGLFECLDKELKTDGVKYHLDGFSRNANKSANGNFSHRAFIPNCVFFGNSENEGLIPLLERYNFTIEENSSTETQVALDPELLGNVFENLLGAFNEETQETARKQSGSFYTPREVVDFMVDESLKAYLKPENELETIFLEILFAENTTETENFLNDNEKLCKKFSEKLKKVKILDPACGSGAFPMGILNRMVELLDKLDVENQKSHHDLKLELIKNCIFGIDIQSIAVQISKLRFFISLIVEQEEINFEKENYGVHTLPNLETKFVAANTLVSIRSKGKEIQGNLFDTNIQNIKEELIKIRREHFDPKNVNQKKILREKDEELRQKISEILEKEGEFSSENVKKFSQWNPYDQNATSEFFDMEWMFGVKDGFDIVIGNPPYIQLQNKRGRLAQLYQNQGFETFARTGDIYQLFYEKGFQILKPHGHLAFITSNKWMRAGYGEKSRAFFCKNTNPKILIDFGGVQVFDSATVDTNILLFAKENNTFSTRAMVMGKEVKKEQLKKLSDYFMQNATISKFSNNENWVILSEIEQRIKEKIEAVGTPLKDWDINIYRGILTGFNEAFIISSEKREEILNNCITEEERQKTDEIIRPILRGRDIKRYGYDFADLYLLFIPWHFPLHENPNITGASKEAEQAFENQYPAIYNHLLQYKTQLSNRNKAETGIRYEWYALQRWGANYWEEFSKQKIIYGQFRKGEFSFDEKGYFLSSNEYFIASDTENLKVLIAFLNSKFCYFYGSTMMNNLGGETTIAQKDIFIKTPIPRNIESKYINEIIRLLEDKSYNKIDKIIYEILQLTSEEIQFIENQ